MDPIRYIKNIARADDGVWKSPFSKSNIFPDHAHQINQEFEERSFWFIHRANCVIDMIKKFPPAGPIFDYGGGTGFLASQITKNGIPTLLVESNIAGIDIAKTRNIHAVIQGGFDNLDFMDNSIAAFGLFDVAEHVKDDHGLLQIIYKKLTPGGRLYLTVPALPLLWSSEDVNAGHFRRYRLKSLTRQLRNLGFKIEFESYFFSFLVAGIYLFRTLPTLIGLRKPGHWACYEAEVKSTSSNFNLILEILCNLERRWLCSKSLPIGSSAIVCARR